MFFITNTSGIFSSIKMHYHKKRKMGLALITISHANMKIYIYNSHLNKQYVHADTYDNLDSNTQI